MRPRHCHVRSNENLTSINMKVRKGSIVNFGEAFAAPNMSSWRGRVAQQRTLLLSMDLSQSVCPLRRAFFSILQILHKLTNADLAVGFLFHWAGFAWRLRASQRRPRQRQRGWNSPPSHQLDGCVETMVIGSATAWTSPFSLRRVSVSSTWQ